MRKGENAASNQEAVWRLGASGPFASPQMLLETQGLLGNGGQNKAGQKGIVGFRPLPLGSNVRRRFPALPSDPVSGPGRAAQAATPGLVPRSLARGPRGRPPRVAGRALPGVAVGGQALPGLPAAAGHREGAPAAAVQLQQQGLGGVLRCLPAVVGSLEHLSNAFIPRLVSCKKPRG